MTDAPDEHHLVGYADPVGKALGFLLPVFRRAAHNMLWVETWSAEHRVAGFAAFTAEMPLILPKTVSITRLGAPCHWAFALGDEILEGAGADGTQILAARLADGSLENHPLLALEVAEFLELPQERLRRAAKAYQSLRDTSEAGAARWRDLTILTADFRRNLREMFSADHLRHAMPHLAHVTARAEGDVIVVHGVDVDQHPMISGPILSALQATLDELQPLYGRRGDDWKMNFQRAREARSANWAGHDIARLRGLVYLSRGMGPARDVTGPREIVGGIGLYGPDDEIVFDYQAAEFPGPSLAMFALDAFDAPLDLPRGNGRVLGVTRRSHASARLARDERAALERAELPTVILPSRPASRGGLWSLMNGEVGESIECLMDPALQLWRRMPDRRAVLVRARGAGPRAADDAWAQIYARLWRLGLTEAEGVRFSAGESVFRGEADLGADLFPLMNAIPEGVIKARIRPDAGALVTLREESPHHVQRRHVDVVDIVMHRQGWRSDRPREDHSGHYRYVGGGGTASIEVPLGKPRTTETLAVEDGLYLLDGDQPRIVATEEAGPQAIVSRLVTEGVILATVRDLSYFPPGASAWSLLGSQIRRFANALPATSRSAYFETLVRAAIARRRVQLDRAFLDHLIGVLAMPELGWRFHLICSQVRYSPEGALARMRVGPKRVAGDAAVEFDLALEHDGPSLWPAGTLRDFIA